MKKIYPAGAVIAALMLALWSVNAQVVTTDPPFPKADEPVTIYFDATQGNGTLAGNAHGIYAHAGVNTQVGTWKYVIGAWGNNKTQPKLTKLGADLYALEITTSIRKYFGAAANDSIYQITLVFRDSTGSPQSEDITVAVYGDGTYVRFVTPGNGKLLQPGDTADVYAAASESDSLFLYLDNQLLASAPGKSIHYSLLSAGAGTQWLKVTAKSDDDELSDSIYFFTLGHVPAVELPANVRNGINYIDDSTVTLVLHDPPKKKEFVFVLGDFNDWLIHGDYYMNRTPDSTHFWLTIRDLEPGKEYIFQYYIDEKLWLADPYAEKISDPWNDKYISKTTYPNLIQYPANRETGIAAVLQTAQQPYEWQVNDFTAPAVEDLVIYELHIRDFVATTDIKTVTDTLDYLQRLGVNAIELMPINEFDGNDSWGYNPAFYFAPDKAYGRKEDYKAFIDECHRRGIAVIIDMVLNHSYGLSPLVQMYYDESAGQWGQPSADNPWYNETCPHEPWCWGYDFDHESVSTQDFIDSVNTFWLNEYKVDGFRFDFTKGFTNTQSGNDGSDYDAARIAILKRMADEIWQANPNAYVILEHLTTNSEEKELAGYGMLLWGNMNHNYNEATMGYPADLSGISYKSRGWSAPNLVGYMESHDEERLMYKNVMYGNEGSWYTVKDTTTALNRVGAAAAFFFTIPGPKMIWQFGELGYDYSINYCSNGTNNSNCRTYKKPIRWNYLDDPRRHKIYTVFSELIKLKTGYSVFRTSDFNLSVNGSLKRVKLNGEEMDVLVIGNFGLEVDSIVPQFQQTGWWYDYFNGDSLHVTDVNAKLQLYPGEYRLFNNAGLTGIRVPGIRAVNTQTFRAWSNQDGTQLTVVFELAEKDRVKLDIYNMQGLRVASMPEGRYSKGLNTITYNRLNDLAAGIYVVRITSANRAQALKVLVP